MWNYCENNIMFELHFIKYKDTYTYTCHMHVTCMTQLT